MRIPLFEVGKKERVGEVLAGALSKEQPNKPTLSSGPITAIESSGEIEERIQLIEEHNKRCRREYMR